MVTYDDCNALVLGAGVSGVSAALLLLTRGCSVTLVDAGPEPEHAEAISQIRAAGGVVLFNMDDAMAPDGFDICVVSPSIKCEHPWLAACAAAGIPVISELELGARYWRGRCMAVTGSKGKSSVVKFLADALTAAGAPAAPAGNYGMPLCQLVLDRPGLQWAIVEVSSFQMEQTHSFHPEVATILNIQADHLDRHGTVEVYRALKEKLIRGMDHGIALLPYDSDATCVPAAVTCMRFGAAAQDEWFYNGGTHEVCGLYEGMTYVVDVRDTWFDNVVLGASLAAAVAMLSVVGVDVSVIEAALRNFKPLPHRMQEVPCSVKGVRCIDDSKGTSLTAMAAAIRMANAPVRLIAGGLLKEKDLDSVKELLTKSVKKGYLIGRSAGQMAQAWRHAMPCAVCGTLDAAVDAALRDAQPGETVLLSPGTASFDQFKSYAERGEVFATAVRSFVEH